MISIVPEGFCPVYTIEIFLVSVPENMAALPGIKNCRSTVSTNNDFNMVLKLNRSFYLKNSNL